MDHAEFEGVLEAEGGLADVLASQRHRQRPAFPHHPREVDAVDEFHRDEVRVSERACVERGHDVRVLHLSERLHLEGEAGLGRRVFQLVGANDLERLIPAESGVVRLEDAAHAAFAEQVADDVVAHDQVFAAAAGDFLDLVDAEPSAAIDLLRGRRYIGMGLRGPGGDVLELRGGEQSRRQEGGEEDGRRVGGTGH